MQYRQFPPPRDLAPWIECAWTLRGPLHTAGEVILPDGRLELIFHFGETPTLNGRRQAVSVIAGRMTSALELRECAAMDTLGVRLRPGACASIVPVDQLRGVECMEAVLGRWARDAREQLGDPRSIAALWRVLRAKLHRPPDAAILHSVARIENARGQGRLHSSRPDGLSERQWQRRFQEHTGFSPKAFARLTRFQHLIALYRAGEHRRWAELALDAGFYDQSHLANEFRQFSGASPEAFFRTGRGMAEFYRATDFSKTSAVDNR